MTKAIFVLVIGLFWCSVGFAMSQQQAIDQYLSGRSLDPVEGIWISPNTGTVTVVYKNQDRFTIRIISSKNASSGEYDGSISKGSSRIYYGEGIGMSAEGDYSCQLTRTLISKNEIKDTCTHVTIGNWSRPVLRIWPEDIKAHNAKYKTKKDIADEEKVVADMVADAKKTCKVLGFKEESEKFADCTLKLYTQKVDELVAEKQAANALMTQSQTTTTTQSSGSNVTTIYDPVRDSRALMQQGQKMLSGGCTLGIDC